MKEIIIYSINDGTKKGKMGIAKSISEAKQICLNTPGIKKQGIEQIIYNPKSRYQTKRRKYLPELVVFSFIKPGTFFRIEVMSVTVVKVPDGYNVTVHDKDSRHSPGFNLTITKEKPDKIYVFTVEDYINRYTNKNRGW